MSEYICKGSLRLGTGCKACRKCFEELEQHSISKDDLRGLVVCHDSLSEYCYRCGDDRKFELIEELNKLIEGGKDK